MCKFWALSDRIGAIHQEGLTVNSRNLGMIGWLFRLKAKYLQKALDKYAEETGTKLELEKSGIPPIKFWLRNRKGDCWGRVRFPDGTVKWVRYRGGFLSSGSTLKFYDV